MARNYFFVFLGGGLGAAARYWLSGAVYRIFPADFPYGTLAVNLIGCFVIGLLMSSLEERFIATPSLRVFLTIGILGGFTTFSSFSYDTVSLLREGELLRAMINTLTSVIGCLMTCVTGYAIGKLL
ncbi:MAG TPA: fluoride efflux transporter CrcB [Bacteroidota bacterium]|nr:fluoride efflux transporter CrcB [Bacteroidota bacterium]